MVRSWNVAGIDMRAARLPQAAPGAVGCPDFGRRRDDIVLQLTEGRPWVWRGPAKKMRKKSGPNPT
jgi:hypothetical protein